MANNPTVVVGDRQTGKTTNLLDQMRQAPEHTVLVCIHRAEADRVYHQMKDEGFQAWQFVTYDDMQKPERKFRLFKGRNNLKFLLDNVEVWIQGTITTGTFGTIDALSVRSTNVTALTVPVEV